MPWLKANKGAVITLMLRDVGETHRELVIQQQPRRHTLVSEGAGITLMLRDVGETHRELVSGEGSLSPAASSNNPDTTTTPPTHAVEVPSAHQAAV
jgi:hypothetical protein